MNMTLTQLSKTFFYGFLLALSISVTSFAQEIDQQSVTLNISIDPALKDTLNPEHTLFVYARAAKGPRMPLAIVSHKAADLPLETQLDASMAMMPQMSLHKFPQVIFLARISASGHAIPQPGDLMGETIAIEWQTLDKPVAVVINKQY